MRPLSRTLMHFHEIRFKLQFPGKMANLLVPPSCKRFDSPLRQVGRSLSSNWRNAMSRLRIDLCAAALLLPLSQASAQEQPAKSKIVSVGLFKNGLAIVKQQIDIAGPGRYRLDDVPEPVHGTWWTDSPAVETTMEMREVEVPDDAIPSGNLQEDLAGKKVTIHLKSGKLAGLQGTVMKLEEP